MSDLDVLREISGRVRPPRYGDLVAVARKRRRRSAAGAVAAAVVLVLAVVTAGAALTGGPQAQMPTQVPSPSRTESSLSGEEWTPERTRAEGSPVSFLGSAPSGLDTQLYCVGQAIPTGSPCDSYHRYDPEEEQHWALEVAQGERMALFDIRGTPWAKDFDDDSILVQDGTPESARFRLLQADGTAMRLRVVSGVAPAVPGPDVMLIEDLGVYRSGMIGPDGSGEQPYLVDDRAGTLQPLDVPKGIAWWGPNVDEFLWGGNGCRVIWQQPDGSFDQHDVDCADSAAGLTDPAWNFRGFDRWAGPGRLALVEYDAQDSFPLAAHVSLDRGDTWQRIPVESRGTDVPYYWSLLTSRIG